MNRLKRLFCVFLVAILVVTLNNTSVALADDAQLDQTDNAGMVITLNGAVDKYFSEREIYLKDGSIQGFSSAVDAMFADEQNHRTQLVAIGAIIRDTSYEIVYININDYGASVEVEETVIYVKGNDEAVEVICHDLFVYDISEEKWIVGRDEYKEDFSDFYSCSYVRESMESYAASDGSQYCIVEVAEGEVGYTVPASGRTKYGEWFGKPSAAWCAMFVCWCADQANVSTSIIPFTAGTQNMKNTFDAWGKFYLSASQGGSYTPVEGDIYFQGTSENEIKHVGIVTSVGSSSFQLVDGNCDGAVASHAKSLNASDLIGFAHPAYGSNSHYAVGSWLFDSNYHWKECDNCGRVVRRLSHVFQNGRCSDCGCLQPTIIQ